MEDFKDGCKLIAMAIMIGALLIAMSVLARAEEGPWSVIWVSSATSENHWPICPVVGNELCLGSYIPDYKNHKIACHKGEDGCQDFVDAMNTAHAWRTTPVIGDAEFQKLVDQAAAETDTKFKQKEKKLTDEEKAFLRLGHIEACGAVPCPASK